MSELLNYLVSFALTFVPLYPKFPLIGVGGTFVSVRLEDFVLAITITVCLLASVKSKAVFLNLPIFKSILLYLCIGFVSLFSAIFLTKTVSPNLGLLHALRRVEYMAMFFVGWTSLKNSRQLGFLIKVILLVSLVVSLYGLGQQFLGFPVISTNNSEFSKGLALTLGAGARINSTFAGHYDLAAFSLFPLLLIVSLIALGVKPRWPLFGIGLLVYWTMLLSASRVTFAAFFVATGLFLWVIRRRLWIIPLFLVGIISVLASPQLLGRYRELITNHIKISVVLPVRAAAEDDQVPDALKPTAEPEDRSLNIRLRVEWPKAMRAFYQNPILGTGFSSVGLAVDNDYLRSLAETGILGFAALSMVIILFLKTSHRYLAPSTNLPSAFVAAITCGLIGLLLNAVFIDVFEASKIAIITWTLLGLAEKAKTFT